MAYYKELEERTLVLEAEAQAIAAKTEKTVEDRERFDCLMGEIRAYERIAGELKDREIEELRAAVARPVVGSEPASRDEAAVASFRAFLKTGTPMDASLTTTDANGGYIVPEPVHAQLIELVRKSDPIFGRATQFDMRGDTTMVLPYKSAHGAVTNAVEAGARSEQNAPTFEGPTLTCYDYYTDQRATQTVLDSVAGMEDMLLGWIFEDIQEQAGADAVSGSGTTKIKGLFSETSAYTVKTSGSNDVLVNTQFLTTYFALNAKYRKNAVWLMSGATLATVAAMSYPISSNVDPLAIQGADGVWRILGKEVVETDSAPAIGDGAYPVAFADIASAYAVGIHRNTTILRDPYTAVPYVRFYGLARMGGCAWDKQAAILMKSDT